MCALKSEGQLLQDLISRQRHDHGLMRVVFCKDVSLQCKSLRIMFLTPHPKVRTLHKL